MEIGTQDYVVCQGLVGPHVACLAVVCATCLVTHWPRVVSSGIVSHSICIRVQSVTNHLSREAVFLPQYVEGTSAQKALAVLSRRQGPFSVVHAFVHWSAGGLAAVK